MIAGRPNREANLILAIGFVAAAWLTAVAGQTQGPRQPLQLSISVESPSVVEPLPLRLVMHFHNSGNRPLWLYKPVWDAGAISQSALGPEPGGSTLAVHLEPEESPASAGSRTPAAGTLLRNAAMPHPHLVRIAPGGDDQEIVVIHIAPATPKAASASGPVWGRYQISVAYSASYSNGSMINSNLGVDVWQGSVSSNQVTIQLGPAPAANVGSISGTVVNRQMQQDWGILVSLSDESEHVVGQRVTGYDGGFSFSHLPQGRYWVTVRRPGARQDTGFFEHADLSASQPDATLKLIMLNPEDYEAKQLLHKPVLFRIADNAGSPVAGVTLEILWSSGTVLEDLKTETSENGVANINLLPGSNYVTIRRRHCPKLEQMANVASGRGIDGFSMTLDCGK